jgi:hypothetical protein
MFVDNLLTSVCRASIGLGYLNGPTTTVQSSLWSFSFRSRVGQSGPGNFTISGGKTPRCSAVETTFEHYVQPMNVHVCQATYNYNPVGFSTAKSLSADNDGLFQRAQKLSWPLPDTACPVSLRFFEIDGKKLITYPKVNMRTHAQLDPKVVRVRTSGQPEKNSFVFLDNTYQATCERWDMEAFTWQHAGARTHAGINVTGACALSRRTPPIPATDGRFSCVYDLRRMPSVTGNESVFFAPVMEPVCMWVWVYWSNIDSDV